MYNNVFFSDLDKTIIYSKEIGNICVERMEDREITYMTERAISLMNILLKKEGFGFIPCTMRNKRQTLRVDFLKEYNPEIMVCTNGAQIYINGELDENWNKYIRSLVPKEEILELKSKIDNSSIPFIENRSIEDFYLTLKFSSEDIAKRYLTSIKRNISNKYSVFRTGIKVFIIDKNIDKKFAVNYLNYKYNFKRIYTAGDSEADRLFTEMDGVISLIPDHATFTNNRAIRTKHKGIKASEEILEYLINDLN